MANLHLRDGFAGNSTLSSGGTGPYTGITAIPGFGNFSALSDGDVIECTVRTGTAFETGKYTKGGGATPSLARTRIFSQIDGSTSSVNWAAGTQVVIHSGLSAKDAASITGENEFETHQHLKANHLTLTTDKLSYLYGTGAGASGAASFVINGVFHSSFGISNVTGEPYFAITHTDAGATAGPGLNLDRVSASPSANDVLGYVNLSGRDDAGNYTTYASIFGLIVSAANGAESGGMSLNVLRAGTTLAAITVNSNFTVAYPGYHEAGSGILVGKFSSNGDNQGIELRSDGAIAATTINQETMFLNRKGSAGPMVSLFRDGVYVGGLTVDAGGVVSVVGAALSHQSLWDGPQPCPKPMRGALLCSTDRVLDDPAGVHPYARLCRDESDPSVYGVYGGPAKVTLRDNSKRRGFLVQATGAGAIQVVGPVHHGQLLEGSNIPGVARGQSSRQQQDGTVAKARGAVPAGERRLIPCTLLAG